MAGTSAPMLTLPFLDAEQLTVPPLETEGIAFVQLWKFRSPVVLQHSDIILASILRIASPRNVGGLGFSSLLVLSLHLHSVSISFCKVRLPSPSSPHNHKKLVDVFFEAKADQSSMFLE